MNKPHNRSCDRPSPRRYAGYLAALLIGLVLAGCSSNPDRDAGVRLPVDNPFKPQDKSPGTPQSPASARELKLKAATLYLRGHYLLVNSEYGQASKEFDKVISRYPFTQYSTQAQLEQIYAQYRNYETDTAGSGADRFLREHPRHPHADYVLYLKGLIDESRDQSLLHYLPINPDEHDPSAKQRAFQDYALLFQRYPHSRYAWDARQRMVALRNGIAAHQLQISRYYIRRGAWLAAAKRAQNIVSDYPGAPATADALLELKRCYSKLGLKDQEKQVNTLIAANSASIAAARSPAVVQTTADATAPTPPPSAAAVPSKKAEQSSADATTVTQETKQPPEKSAAGEPGSTGIASGVDTTESGDQNSTALPAISKDAAAQPDTAATHNTPTTSPAAATQ